MREPYRTNFDPTRTVRGSATSKRARGSLGPCYRCAAKGAPLMEYGPEGDTDRIRLCPPCVVALDAKPVGTANAAREGNERTSHAWESAPPVAPPMTGEDFRRTAERILGRERARQAMLPDSGGGA